MKNLFHLLIHTPRDLRYIKSIIIYHIMLCKNLLLTSTSEDESNIEENANKSIALTKYIEIRIDFGRFSSK